MRWKATLVLLVAVVGLGLFILFYEQETPGTDWSKRDSVFPAFDEEAGKKIDRVEIERPKDGGREKLVIEKKEKDRWELVEPIKYRADRYKASGVVTDLRYAEKREVRKGVKEIRAKEGEKLKLEDYGLDEKATAFIRLYSGDELKYELKVGSKGVTDRNCYVQAMPDESAVYVSDASLHTDATDELSAYRDKDVVLVKSTDVTKLVVRRPKETLEFVKKGEVWEMTSPLADRTKSNDVQGFASSCANLRVDEFIKDGVTSAELADYGLDSPEYTVVLTAKEKGEPTDRQILFGKAPEGKAKKRYCMRGGSETVFTVNFDYISKDMLKEANEFRDSKLARVDPDDANRLAIERQGARLAFSKVEYDWKIEEPKERAGDADYDAVKKLLEELRDAEIKDYLPPGTGLTGGITVTIGFKSEKSPEESFTVLKSGKKALAKRKGSKNVFAVDPSLVEKVSGDVLQFMSKKIFHVPSSDVVWLRVEKEGKSETAEYKAADWRLVETPGEIDVDRIKNDIVWPLSDLYAQKLFGEAEGEKLKACGLDAPWAKVGFKYKEKVKTEDGEEGEKEELKEVVVLFGSETKDGRRYAKLADSKMVFEVSASLVEGVTRGLCKEKPGGEKEDEKKGEETVGGD